MTNVIPLVPNDLIPEDEVSVSRLAAILSAAMLEIDVDDDGDIHVTEGIEFPIWVDIDQERKLIRFFTFCEMGIPADAATFTLVNGINRKRIVTQFNYAKDSLWGHYWMPYSGGLNARQFVKMLRTFSSVFLNGAHELYHTAKIPERSRPSVELVPSLSS